MAEGYKLLNVFENRKNLALFLLYFVFVMVLATQAIGIALAKQQRRDPFVPLVDQDGNILSGQDLFMASKEILPKIVLKGILWDEKNPLAIINGKVLSEGSKIILTEGSFAEVIIIEKIKADSVVLNYNDREFIMKLREKEKEKE